MQCQLTPASNEIKGTLIHTYVGEQIEEHSGRF